MQNLCRQLQVSSIDEIIALIALYRPGPMEWIPDYIRGKKDPSTVTFPHPLLEEVCRETYGVMVYQEQVMEAAKIIAGYTLGGADMLRRAMGKKDADAMAMEREKFVDGRPARCTASTRRPPNAIFDILNKFAGYGFNKSHSAAYAILSYQTGYLKANYPVQFMAAMLSTELGNADKVAHFIAECEAMGIQVLGPDVNESRETFTPVGDKIRFGLAGIKGVGELAAARIIEERERNGPFADFDDFVAPGRRPGDQQAGPRAPGEDRRLRLQRRPAQGPLRRPRHRDRRESPPTPATRPPGSTASSTCSQRASPPTSRPASARRRDTAPAAGLAARAGGGRQRRATFPRRSASPSRRSCSASTSPATRWTPTAGWPRRWTRSPPRSCSGSPAARSSACAAWSRASRRSSRRRTTGPGPRSRWRPSSPPLALNMFADAYAAYGGALAENAPCSSPGNVIAGPTAPGST